jgi:hypothetical protein
MISSSHLRDWLPGSTVSTQGRERLLDALAALRRHCALTVGTEHADLVLAPEDFAAIEALVERSERYKGERVIVRKI